ncbi:X-ray repair cross-complementing protein 5 [Sergentomyia squamirostris]
MCIGFSPEKFIRPKFYTGSGTNIILPQKNCSVSSKMFYSLVMAMKKLGVVMIARRVYNIRSKPKIEVLIPCDKDGIPYLTMLELPFSDGIVDFHFNSFCDKKTAPSQEQLEAVDKLIDGMDLMTASEEDEEAFTSQNTINLTAQFTYRILAARALHPAQPLPALDDDLREHLIVPKKIQPLAQETSDELKRLFQLVPKAQSKKDIWLKKLFKPLANPDEPVEKASDEDGTNVLNVVESDIVEVGSVTPAEDFAFLMHRGEKFSTISAQIESVISSLVFSVTILQREKVVKAIFALREAVKVMESAYRYNEWITEFQGRLVERKKGEFWEDVIVKEGLGLITASEHSSSTVTDEEAQAFYKIDPNAVPSTSTAPETAGNVDDLFDDM